MSFIPWANKKVSKLEWLDMALVKWSVFFFTLMIVKFWPNILNLEWYWYLLIWIILAIKPFIKVFSK